MSFPLSRRTFCLVCSVAPVVVSPLLSAVSAFANEPPAPETPDTNDDLPAESLHAIGVRMLKEGRSFEKAATRLRLAAQKEPNRPEYLVALGCALASRAASLSRATLFSSTLAQQQADFPERLKEWEAGRAEWDALRAQSSQFFIHQTYEDLKPVAPQPFSVFTKDDKAPFHLTAHELAAQLSTLSRQAQAAWEQAIALSKTPDEKAEALYVQAWGLHVLYWSLFIFDAEGNIGPNAFVSGADYGADQKVGQGADPQEAAASAKAPPTLPSALPKLSQSIKAAEEAVRLSPKTARYVQAVGDFLSQTSKDKAFAAYEEALTLAPKDRNLLYLMYQKTATKAWEKTEKPLLEAYRKGEMQKLEEGLFAIPLGYLHRAAARDRANAWPLYEEAALLFRTAPYIMMGAKGNYDATLEQKQAALKSVRTARARTQGKRAIDLIVQGNSLPIFAVPEYEQSVPPLLKQAWGMTSATSPFLVSDEVFDSFARLRELARATGGYSHVMAENENNASEGVRASRAAIAMGEHLIGNAPLTKSEHDENTTGLGAMIASVGYRNLIKLYRTMNDAEGVETTQKELDAFQKGYAAFQKARRVRTDQITREY